MTTTLGPRAISDELANTLTHLLGLVLSLVGAPGLIFMAARYGDAWHVLSCSVYGVALVLLYAASTTYHWVQAPRLKQILRVVDHACIYLLIAGTYTPFTLVTIGGPWGWTLFSLVWGLAVIGICFKILWTGRFEFISTLTYVLMGWMALIAVYPIVTEFPLGCTLWILAGGSSYTIGVIFYAFDSKPYMHAIWHLFVLAGSACHYVAVMEYVLPSGALA